MNLIADKVLKYKRAILAIFILLAMAGALLQSLVKVNYNMANYLPEDAASTVSLRVMQAEFTQSTPNVRIYIPDVTIPEASALKKKLAQVRGVTSVLWLDDVINIYEPVEMADTDTVKAWYQDGGALFSITADSIDAPGSLQLLREVAGADAAISGDLVNYASAQTAAKKEVTQVMIFLLPMILFILLLATRSWLEPVLFLITIGISILINMGSNLIFGEISFITQAVSAVLQLAVSMDYAIFLLSRFSQYRDEGMDTQQAMKQAMVKASAAVIASAATTIFGFLALVLMRFKVGPDMGIVLAKGIVLSLISVMIFLPALALVTYKWLDKTHHRSLLPTFKGFGRFVARICVPVLIIVALLIVPSYMAQQENHFLYGASSVIDPAGREGQEAALINKTFGETSQMVLMVPREQWGREDALYKALDEIPQVTSIISYATAVGQEIPTEVVPQDQLSQLMSDSYSRIIIAADIPGEGEETFKAVEAIRAVAHDYYGDSYYLVGSAVNTYDMKETVVADNALVNIVAIIAIGLVLLLAFRSLTLPLILLLTIETAIWINLAIPYFTGTPLNYIGFLIINTVQLGATVDYGILFSLHYLDNRMILGKREAAALSVTQTAPSILTSAGILTLAGLTLSVVSTNGIISELGLVLGRGAAISATMVLLFLPALLRLLDKVVEKTTMHTRFNKKGKVHNEEA